MLERVCLAIASADVDFVSDVAEGVLRSGSPQFGSIAVAPLKDSIGALLSDHLPSVVICDRAMVEAVVEEVDRLGVMTAVIPFVSPGEVTGDEAWGYPWNCCSYAFEVVEVEEMVEAILKISILIDSLWAKQMQPRIN